MRRSSSQANTTRILSRPLRPTKKPTSRDSRLLGKFSLLAGLHLPEPVHRQDYVQEQRLPTTYTYNVPMTHWGPYVAAVYEPLPFVSFLENPLGYLASILNPYNWFATAGTGIVDQSSVAPDKNQEDDVLVVLQGHEVPNEDRDLAEMKIDQGQSDGVKVSTHLFIVSYECDVEWFDK